MMASHIRVLVKIPAALFAVQYLNIWISSICSTCYPKYLASATLTEDQDRVPSSWLPLGPDLADVVIWGVSQQMEDLSVCLSLALPFK